MGLIGGEIVCISLERKGKPSIFSKDAAVVVENGEAIALFKETINFSITLHKTASGSYQVSIPVNFRYFLIFIEVYSRFLHTIKIYCVFFLFCFL
jgi:hypothetical protein